MQQIEPVNTYGFLGLLASDFAFGLSSPGRSRVHRYVRILRVIYGLGGHHSRILLRQTFLHRLSFSLITIIIILFRMTRPSSNRVRIRAIIRPGSSGGHPRRRSFVLGRRIVIGLFAGGRESAANAVVVAVVRIVVGIASGRRVNVGSILRMLRRLLIGFVVRRILRRRLTVPVNLLLLLLLLLQTLLLPSGTFSGGSAAAFDVYSVADAGFTVQYAVYLRSGVLAFLEISFEFCPIDDVQIVRYRFTSPRD